jgi:hypothetical protein
MHIPKVKNRKSAQIFAGITYIVFISIYGQMFYSMAVSQGDVLIVNLVLASIGLATIWLLSLGYLKVIMTAGRPDITAVLWFALSFITFLICQILIFGVMYKATGLTTKGTMDNMAYFYFSVMTLTTVGYGDITPTDAGRLVAMIQAISGYIYMGIFIGVTTSLIMSVNQNNGSKE